MFITRKKVEALIDDHSNSYTHSKLDGRYWELFHRFLELEKRHNKLLDYLGLEEVENPKTSIVKKEP